MNQALPPAWFLLSVLVMGVLHAIAPAVRWLAFPWTLAGLVLVLGGILIMILAHGLFTKRRTTIHPFGESSVLVTTGPYRFTRNPMYLAMVVVLLGIGVLMGTATPFTLIPLFGWFITMKFIRREEAQLSERFGEAYEEYRRRVRRWI